MNRRAGTMLGLTAMMALAIGMAWYGKREPEKPKRPAPVPKTTEKEPEVPPPVPVDPPPVEPPPVEPHPPLPAGNPGPGWRFGDNWIEAFHTAPAGLAATCERCHAIPAPTILPSKEWRRIMGDMNRLMHMDNKPADPRAMEEILSWYEKHAPSEFEKLPAAPDAGALEFRKESVGMAHGTEPRVANVNIADLDGDGKLETVVCDGGSNSVSLLKRTGKGWEEQILAVCTAPGHSAVVDADGDGDLDVVVAGLGNLMPTDEATGTILLLENNGAKGWTRREIATGLPRVADAEPADVDGDGDMDFIVGAFGWRKTGFIGWLRNDGGGQYTIAKLTDRTGPIHVPVADLDGDGRADFLALVAQESESIFAYMNKGGGTFEAKPIFEAKNPLFGSSGIQIVDLDRDGDLDVLYSNGDALDDPTAEPKPYHGVQWLENKGELKFEVHDIGRCYGAYRAIAVDLDGDGDLDVAVAVLFGKWADTHASGLLWYENDGARNFKRHDVASAPSHIITLAAGDLDGDGIPELVSGRMVVAGQASQGEGLLVWKITRPK
ncbi:MAG: FG-GAP-like repeat-containing protein [Planctomycetes bacterium]|nr:FG-GAP-like repeat-containing protein [Planctomycetota bacterium]